jgi:hypothetical protein
MVPAVGAVARDLQPQCHLRRSNAASRGACAQVLYAQRGEPPRRLACSRALTPARRDPLARIISPLACAEHEWRSAHGAACAAAGSACCRLQSEREAIYNRFVKKLREIQEKRLRDLLRSMREKGTLPAATPLQPALAG